MRGLEVGAGKPARCQEASEGPGSRSQEVSKVPSSQRGAWSCLDIAREFIGLLVQDDATDFKAELASDNDVTYENNW